MKREMIFKDKFAGMAPALIYKGTPIFYMNSRDVLYGCEYKEFFPNAEVDTSEETLGCFLTKRGVRKREIYGVVVNESVLCRDYKGEELRARKLAVVYHELGHRYLGDNEFKAQKWAIERAYKEGASKALTILIKRALNSPYVSRTIEWLLIHPVFSKISEVHQLIRCYIKK